MRPRMFLPASRASSLTRPKSRFDTKLLAVAMAVAACGSDAPITGDGVGSAKDGGSSGNRDGGAHDARVATGGGGNNNNNTPIATHTGSGVCSGLQCQQRDCGGGATTTISGTIYDPAGKNPLYNVAVYVPNDTVEDLKSGAACDTCASLYTGTPIASALTDAAGTFTIQNAPVGTDIPLVVQVGKWRRQFKIATVTACTDNPQADKSLRLPRNHSEGDIPNIAVSTGGADTLECLLRRVGVDAAEFVPGDSAEGRVHIYQGNAGAPLTLGPITIPVGQNRAPNTMPGGPSSSASLWNTVDNLLKYDIVLLSCEGDETQNMNQQALHDYTDAGGRVFASHFHYSWFNTGPYSTENLASWETGPRDLGDINGDIVTTLANGQPFVKGQALESWLGTVGALQNGKLPIQQARNNATVTAANIPSQAWIVADQKGKPSDATQYFSFNTPNAVTGADFVAGTCGRVVYSDLHVGAASGDDPRNAIPKSCRDADLSAQEKALEFMLFDLSSCITPDTAPPAPPIIVAI
ncbi:MAG: hypothetical protein JWN04_2569 [Myxococcaceae bacterium]|nr:hypothetical protein [Myxococcaceae bacterium]